MDVLRFRSRVIRSSDEHFDRHMRLGFRFVIDISQGHVKLLRAVTSCITNEGRVGVNSHQCCRPIPSVSKATQSAHERAEKSMVGDQQKRFNVIEVIQRADVILKAMPN
jgi:hypothetical protein